MHYHTTQSGYSLVEVLVSISVLLIATVGPMAIATQGLKSSQFALEQNTAYFLAQEGIEAMFAIRNHYALEDIDDGLDPGDDDSSWDWVIANGVLLNNNAAPCPSSARLNADGKSCDLGVEFNGGPENQVTLHNCNGNNDVNCRIYRDESDDRAIYSHQSSGGVETPFSRIITITRESNDSIKVESKVIWESGVFNSQRDVSATTYLFDSNFEPS